MTEEHKDHQDEQKNSGESQDNKTMSNVSDQSSGNLPPNFPKQIGKFRLKRIIASGGMGTVFEGIQENPRRSVAVKIIKGSDVSDKAKGRLKYEAQMLARLRHPGIAEIYEAGTFEDQGIEIPYFAMEYIPNAKTLTEYARSKELTVEQKLELFLQVCDAVNYGHQRGIVHRDLKPGNILVDSNNKARIIDFGLAKATDSDLRQTNMQTEVGQIIGTLQYMSPEQFDADSQDLDTRSDVYSLGIVLYELLSGTLPFDLKSKKIFEVADIIRRKEPASLSKSGLKIAPEVDTILHKALRKDREQRYQTAYGLGRDIKRFLDGEAIDARPPSLAYQLRVFTRKNKLLVASMAATFVLLIAGVAVSTSLLFKVNEERKTAILEAEKAKKAHDFLTSIFNTAIPKGFGDQVPISNLLDKSTKMLEGAFPDDPEIEAEIRTSLGRGYFALGKYKEAEDNFSFALRLRKETLGQTDEKTKSSLQELKWLYTVTGDFDNYLGNCQELCRLDSMSFGANNENTLESKMSVVVALERNGDITGALKLAEDTRDYCKKEFPDNIKLLNQASRYLGWLQLQNGQFDESEKLAKETFEIASSRIEEGWYSDASKSLFAASLISNGKLDEAVELYGQFPTYPKLDREFDLQGSFDPDKSEVLLIVFWEEWCPFCDRMMKRVENLYRQYHNYGIDVVGVTHFSKNSTREKCEDFLRAHNITFPVIKESGKAFDYFDCGGVPSIRLIYEGKLIWEKNVPSIEPISRHMVEGIIKAKKRASR